MLCPASVAKRVQFLLVVVILSLGGRNRASAADEAMPSSIAPPFAALPSVATPRVVAPADRFTDLFQPFRTDLAALSPDGKYLAYSLREGETLSVAVVEVDQPGHLTAKMTVASDLTSTRDMSNDREKTPAMIRWMRWTTATQIAVETNQFFGGSSGALFAFDFDGKNSRTLVTPDEVAMQVPVQVVINPKARHEIKSRSFRVLDLSPSEPTTILLRTDGLARYDLYRVNSLTGKVRLTSTEVVRFGCFPLADRQGKVRVSVPASTLFPFPHHFSVDQRSGLSTWTDLDQIAGFTLPGFSLSPETILGERAIPIGFDRDPNILYYGSNIGRDTYGLYSLNLKTRSLQKLAIENPTFDLIQPSESLFADPKTLVYDRFTGKVAGARFTAHLRTAAWLVPALQTTQNELESTLPGRSIDLLDWDSDYKRILVLAQGPVDAGAYYIFDRETAKLAEFVRRAPQLEAKEKLTRSYAFENPKGGGTLSGLITLPRAVRIQPIPVIVLCAKNPWSHTETDYSGEIDALAEMGMAVVQLNGRGTWGFGTQQRKAIQAGFEKAQVEDLGSVVDFLLKQYPMLSPKHIAVMGESHGGHLALRALQLDPVHFRCAVAINPVVDFSSWIEITRWTTRSSEPVLSKAYFGDNETAEDAPLIAHPETIDRPVCIFSFPGRDGAKRLPNYRAAKQFAAELKSHQTPTEFYPLTADYEKRLPLARAQVFNQIEDFLNTYLYSYKVDVKETIPLKG